MDTPRTFIKTLGVANVAKAVGATEGRVRQVQGDEFIPAIWFRALEGLAASRGVRCPDALFNFKHGEPAA